MKTLALAALATLALACGEGSTTLVPAPTDGGTRLEQAQVLPGADGGLATAEGGCWTVVMASRQNPTDWVQGRVCCKQVTENMRSCAVDSEVAWVPGVTP